MSWQDQKYRSVLRCERRPPPAKEKGPDGRPRWKKRMRVLPWQPRVQVRRTCCVCGKHLVRGHWYALQADALIGDVARSAGWPVCDGHAEVYLRQDCFCGQQIYVQRGPHLLRGRLVAGCLYKSRRGEELRDCPACQSPLADSVREPTTMRTRHSKTRQPLIIALCGEKGGVGKSTTAICLAAEAQRRGHRVLLVDADPQATTQMWVEEAAAQDRPAPELRRAGADMHQPGVLDVSGFDLVVVDCPGRIDNVTKSALMLAHVAVVPCGPSQADVWALSSSVQLVKDAQGLRPELRAYILIAKKRPRTAQGKGARACLAKSSLPILSAELADRLAYQEALAAGMGVTAYAPHGLAAAEVTGLYNELRRRPKCKSPQ